MRRKKDDFVDDGRTIADMNVDGMPMGGIIFRRYSKKQKLVDKKDNIVLTKKERKLTTRGIYLANLLVSTVFLVGLGAFVLFYIYVCAK